MDDIDTTPLDLGDGRAVLFDEPASGCYRVRMPSGEVQAFPAQGEATRENAEADIEAARADLEPRRADLRARAKQRRREVEEGGITLPNGAQIDTDNVSQSKLDGALSLASLSGLGAQFATKWKCANGEFRTVTQADLIALALAVGTHVQACFQLEADLSAAIDAAETPEELDQVAAAIEAFALPSS